MKRHVITILTAALAIVALLAPAILAQTDSSAPFPGAKKMRDNGYFIIWDVTYAPGKSTDVVQPSLDQVAVFLTDGAVKYSRPNGSSVIEQHRLGSVRYVSKGTAEAVEGLEHPVRAMVFQLADKVPPS